MESHEKIGKIAAEPRDLVDVNLELENKKSKICYTNMLCIYGTVANRHTLRLIVSGYRSF